MDFILSEIESKDGIIQNLGQMNNTDGIPAHEVRFARHTGNTSIFFLDDRISYVFYEMAEIPYSIKEMKVMKSVEVICVIKGYSIDMSLQKMRLLST